MNHDISNSKESHQFQTEPLKSCEDWFSLLALPKSKDNVKIPVHEVIVFHTFRGQTIAEDNYSGFNLCHYVGDKPEHVEVSKQLLAKRLEVALEKIIVPTQKHTVRVLEVNSNTTPADIDGVDGVVTRERGLVIGVNTADCVPIILVDYKSGIVGAVHAGWRGALGGITQNALEKMQELGSKSEDIKAVIGPCICQDCFEVGEEVACQFPEEVIDRSREKPHVDLRGYVKNILQSADVRVEDCGLCTKENPDQLFSARAVGIKSGRVFTGVMLK